MKCLSISSLECLDFMEYVHLFLSCGDNKKWHAEIGIFFTLKCFATNVVRFQDHCRFLHWYKAHCYRLSIIAIISATTIHSLAFNHYLDRTTWCIFFFFSYLLEPSSAASPHTIEQFSSSSQSGFSPRCSRPIFWPHSSLLGWALFSVPTLLPPAHILVSGDANSAEILDDFLR